MKLVLEEPKRFEVDVAAFGVETDPKGDEDAVKAPKVACGFFAGVAVDAGGGAGAEAAGGTGDESAGVSSSARASMSTVEADFGGS